MLLRAAALRVFYKFADLTFFSAALPFIAAFMRNKFCFVNLVSACYVPVRRGAGLNFNYR